MKREIKFRAWDKKNNCWYKPTFEDYKGNLSELMVSFSGDLLEHNIQGISHESVFLDRYELMQFTGLLDKNGKEIYEGDIVSIPDSYEDFGFMSGEKREVYYADGGFRLKPKNTSGGAGHWCDSEMKNCTIIGNIYENPNILN